MGKKKKPSSKRRAAAAELAQEEAREELLALAAIYGDDIDVHEGHESLGFSLRVVPHPGEASVNFVATTLVVHYPDEYPSKELRLKLTDARGLQEAAVRQLSKSLHQQAAQFAAAGEVCCFQLITSAHEFLQQHNAPPDEEDAQPAAPQSLWHEMLQRDAEAAAATPREQSLRTPPMGDFFDALDGGGLFSDAGDLPLPGAGAFPPMHASTPAVPVMEVRSKPAARPANAQRPLHGGAAEGPSAARPPPATLAGAAAAQSAAAAALPPPAAQEPEEAGGAFGGEPSMAGQQPVDADLPATAEGRQGSGALPAAASSDPASGLRRGDSSVSAVSGGSMLRTLGHSLRGVLPKALRRYVDGGEATPDSSEAGEAGGREQADADRRLMRQELFLGHLLTLAAASGAVPPHALPSLAGSLQAQGLLPKWLAFTLTQQPALFDRAFQRVFRKELREAAEECEEGEVEDPMRWAVQRFWKRRAAQLVPSRSAGHMRSRSGVPSPRADSLPASRYEQDFAELEALGRGGYGVVVAAINRLDGRQYAVKKIPLDAHSGGAYERIMREVTTLSRLQHANVVRYYQAWVEACAVTGGGAESELDEWGSATMSPSSTMGSGQWGVHAPSLPPRPGLAGGAAAPGGRGQLAPVAEVSREGRASTPSKGTRGLGTATGSSSTSGSGSSSDGGSEGSSSSSSSDSSGQETEGSGSDGSGSEGSGLEAEGSASVGLGLGLGNMAVAGANTLLAGGGGKTQPTGLSSCGSLELGSGPDSRSRSAALSGSSGDATAGAAAAGRGGQAAPSSASDSSDFTFDRSRPPRGGASLSVPSATVPPSRHSGQRQRALQQTLFIQMEFCPRTLRDVLDGAGLEEERRWSILRQILAGLAHIHSQGIIHRDLKPANTFLDSQGNVKLGDFGLAKYNHDSGPREGDAAPAPQGGGAQGPWGGAASAQLSEPTGLVGTSYYISPEIAQGWASYDARVDLFSLGVMAFELWHPFATAMERAVLLRDLRERGDLPPGFERDHPAVTRLIRWLMAPNPAQRPTAAEVLRSPLLPPQVLDEQLTDLLRCLPDSPAMHERVLEAVFGLAPAPPAASALEAAGAPIPVQVPVRDHVLSVLRDAFERHGAVGMCSLEVGLAGGDEPAGAVQLLTPGGSKLSLRWELRQAFVAWLVAQVAAGGGAAALLLDGLRRYEVAAVQRRVPGQGLPRTFLQADLDVLLPGNRGPAGLLLGDAEVITATHGALVGLPECGEVEVRLGHRALFDLSLAFVGVSREARGSVAQLLATAATASPLHAAARSRRWPAIKAGLEGIGLSPEAVGRCRQLVLQAAGEAGAALHRLRTLLAHAAARRAGSRAGPRAHGPAAALACLDELSALLAHLAAWGLPPASLLVDPLLAPHSDAFSGVLFQCHLVARDSGAAAVVAAGGRYDSLLRAAWARQCALSGTVSALPPLHAAGVTLNVDRLVAAAQASARWRPPGNPAPVAGLARLSSADVLVCSRGGGGLLRERMALVRALWDAGLSAELLPAAAPSLTEQFEYAHSRGIPWLVIIAASTFEAADTVRVKAMHARQEEDVSVADLPAYLLNALHPHGGGPAGAPPRAQHAHGRPADDGDAEGEQEEGGRERQRRGGRR